MDTDYIIYLLTFTILVLFSVNSIGSIETIEIWTVEANFNAKIDTHQIHVCHIVLNHLHDECNWRVLC